MGRCVLAHRFLLLLSFALWAGAGANAGGRLIAPVAAISAGQTGTTEQNSPQASTSESNQADKTEQYTLPHDKYEKAIAYSRAGYALYFVSYVLTIAAILLLLRLGIAAKFRDFAEGVSERRWLQGLVFVPLLIFAMDVCDLPVRTYWHALSLRYEQSIQSWGSWIWDWGKEELLHCVFAIILVLILYSVMRRSPRRWWLYFWFAALPIILGIIISTPWIIDPLFSHFELLDLKHPELTAGIERLTHHAGLQIPRDRVFLMDASRKTNSINAYVTGLSASKRIVVYDTTIQKMSSSETLFILGHELGHYVLGHVWKGFLFFSIALLAALYLIFRGLHWALHRWSGDWKIYGPEDWASLAVILLLLQVVSFFSAPIANGFSRLEEHAADVYGLELIHGVMPNSEDVAARAFQRLGELDLADPNPSDFITFWLYSHPPLAERLVFAHNYDPWAKGEPPKYVK